MIITLDELDDKLPSNEIECFQKYSNFSETAVAYCPSMWDSFFCWPPTISNHTVEVPCQIILSLIGATVQSPNEAVASRICNNTGHWFHGNWTNYTQCLAILSPTNNASVPVAVGYILFICSLASIILLTFTLFIFIHFKSLECPRLRVHRNLVVALIVNCFTLSIISSPIVLGQNLQSYRDFEILCKFILSSKMYSALSSINWMFIEGLLLHSRITTSIFKKSFPFKLYYLIGWGLPLIIIIVWSCLMLQQLHTSCWEGYGKLEIIWLITAPMIFVLMINFVFLINIIRILVTRLKITNSEETTRIRKAIKATILLFPLLGTTHLLFCLNPKNNELEEAYMITNAFLQSSQGIFVSFFYCFLNNDVQNAVRNAYLRACIARNGGKRMLGTVGKRHATRTTILRLDDKTDDSKTNLKLTLKNNKTQCTAVKPRIEEMVL